MILTIPCFFLSAAAAHYVFKVHTVHQELFKLTAPPSHYLSAAEIREVNITEPSEPKNVPLPAKPDSDVGLKSADFRNRNHLMDNHLARRDVMPRVDEMDNAAAMSNEVYSPRAESSPSSLSTPTRTSPKRWSETSQWDESQIRNQRACIAVPVEECTMTLPISSESLPGLVPWCTYLHTLPSSPSWSRTTQTESRTCDMEAHSFPNVRASKNRSSFWRGTDVNPQGVLYHPISGRAFDYHRCSEPSPIPIAFWDATCSVSTGGMGTIDSVWSVPAYSHEKKQPDLLFLQVTFQQSAVDCSSGDVQTRVRTAANNCQKKCVISYRASMLIKVYHDSTLFIDLHDRRQLDVWPALHRFDEVQVQLTCACFWAESNMKRTLVLPFLCVILRVDSNSNGEPSVCCVVCIYRLQHSA